MVVEEAWVSRKRALLSTFFHPFPSTGRWCLEKESSPQRFGAVHSDEKEPRREKWRDREES